MNVYGVMMMTYSSGRGIVAVLGATLLMGAFVGCGGPQSDNRSTLADSDPVAYERAKSEAEQADQQAKAAESQAVGDVLLQVERP